MSAQSHKEKGNTAFKAGDYYSAIGHYTAAIIADPNNSTFPLNRAATYLKLDKFVDAERDCTTVLRLSSSSTKGWFRRGQARLGLGNYAQAQSDFQQVLRLDGQNEAARQELKKIEELLKGKPKVTQPLETSPPNPQRRRVPITIVDPSSSKASSAPSHTSSVTSSKIPDPEPSPHPVKSTTPPKPHPSQDAQQSGPSKPLLAGGGIFRRNGQHTIFNSASDTQGAQEVKSEPSSAEKTRTTNSDAAAPVAPQVLPIPNGLLMSASISLFDLTRKWEYMKTSRERWTLLANNVPPASLPSLFKTSLETSFLISILEAFGGVLHEYPDSLELRAAVKDYMFHFPQVARFSTVVLLTSPQEKAVIQSLWNNWDDQSGDEAQTRIKLAWRTA